ncbi:amidophosphoribosyltransferase [Nanchangia anserum]|uniref:amidophosphoribosyltransferase n=1 Tax=Nanchangia anserum TaxID=2692125 RepID=UPI001D0FA6C6|nr:amidophosphoribosyltransferase [Nanchangia anserum]
MSDECGVFGVWSPGEDVARMTYFALYALQHRGTQSAGIAAADGSKILVYKDMGLVSQVFSDQNLSALRGHIALGHVRYATTGADTWENAQPTLAPTADGANLALAHNGNITNHAELTQIVEDHADDRARRDATTDTSILTALLGAGPGVVKALAASALEHDRSVPARPDSGDEAPTDPLLVQCLDVLPHVVGAFSLVFATEDALYAARDPHGIRPLVLGRLSSGWCVASETAALDIVGASMVREIEPGEVVAISARGVDSYRFAAATPHGCAFEYVYLARPDTKIAGRSVLMARTAMGAALARRNPVEADLVIATPDSGTPAAIGYAQESGIPFGQGLMKNAYVGRTFIQPSQTLRKRGISLKLNPVREAIEGKRLVVVDDSIVRGNTQRAVVKMLREAGAKEVHVRISAPEVTWPCFFGIDFATRAELASATLDVDALCAQIGADSLAFLDVDDLVAATGQDPDHLCTACFTGHYPVAIPAGTPIPGTPGVVTPSPRDAYPSE